MAFTKIDVAHVLFNPRLLLFLILQDHHQWRPWVSLAPLSLFPLLYHLVQVFSWFCLILSMFISKFFFYSKANKKILLHSGKGVPKSLWWEIEAWSILGGDRGWGFLPLCKVLGRIRRTCFWAKKFPFL